MNAILDFEYVLKYLKWVDANNKKLECGKAMDLTRLGCDLLTEKTSSGYVVSGLSIAPGYPKFGDNKALMEKYGFYRLPGVDNTTWCIYFVYLMLEKLYPGKGKLVCDASGEIGNTTGTECAIACEKNLVKIDLAEAQRLANEGRLIIIAAKGINGHDGHVGVLAPSIPGHQTMVMQAGQGNGFFTLQWAFAVNLGYVESPKFYKIP